MRSRNVACVLGAGAVVATVLVVVGASAAGAVVHLLAAAGMVWLARSRLVERASPRVAQNAFVASSAVVVLAGASVWSALGVPGGVGPDLVQVALGAAVALLLVSLGSLTRLVLVRTSTRMDALLTTGTLTWCGTVAIPWASSFGSDVTWELRATAPVLVSVPLLFVLHLLLVVRERTAATHRAHHDALTGLANRERFRELLDRDLDHLDRGRGALAVMSVGLHRFRAVNDNYGYAVGDELLRAVAGRLVDALPADASVARVDGTTFEISLPSHGGDQDAQGLAHELLAALTTPFWLQGRVVTVGASIGVALAPEDGRDREILIRAAELARQHAKRDGPLRVERFVSSMHLTTRLRHALEAALQTAIERRDLHVAYQPRIDRRGEVVAAEALMRWEHPTLGTIPPSVFVPVAEASGLIEALGDFVLDAAVGQVASWRARGVLDIPVSVNVSTHQLRDPTVFRASIEEALARTGIPPDRLELELTESALPPAGTDLATALVGLRAMGVRLAIDDFGTGYSALSYLTTLPIDGLKIDRSFVATVGRDGYPTPVIDAIIALGTSLGLFVVAEGVETPVQARYLLTRGCHELQGFLFGRPRSAESLEHAVHRRRSAGTLLTQALSGVDDPTAERSTRRARERQLHGALGWDAESPWSACPDPDAVDRVLRALTLDGSVAVDSRRPTVGSASMS